MGVNRKTIISEVEDAVRALSPLRHPFKSEDWARDRKSLVRDAAWMILLIERGDRDYAAEAEEAN